MSVSLLPEKVSTTITRTSADALTTQFLNMKLGSMICFNMNTFVGAAGQMFSRQVQHPAKFNLGDVDVKTWATQMAASGKVKYCYLTIWNEMGFSLYPSQIINDNGPVTVTGYALANQTVPAYQRYNVGASITADQNIIGKFYTEFKKVGIEPGIYINTEGGYNHTARSAAATWMTDPSASYYSKLQKMLANELYEILVKYPFKYVWFDTDVTYTSINNSLLYSAIKTASPRTLITQVSHSTATAGFDGRFPYDVKSFEYYASPTSLDAKYSTTQAYNGVNYYVPKEIITTVLLNEQYYYVNPDYLYDQPGFSVDQLHTQPEIQTIYDKAKANAANCCLSVYADKTGAIPQAQVDLISGITL